MDKYIGFFDDTWFISDVKPAAGAIKPDQNDINEVIAKRRPHDDGNKDQHCPPIGLWSVSDS